MYIQDDIYKDKQGKWRIIRDIEAGDSFCISAKTLERFIHDQKDYATYTKTTSQEDVE